MPNPIGGGPRNCLFVPASVRSRVLQWGHSSRLACHPFSQNGPVHQSSLLVTLPRSQCPGSSSRPATSTLGARPPTSLHQPPAFCRGIGATVSLSSGYHPQTNGQAERANQALEATLRCVTTSKPASWSLHLPWAEYSLNSMVSSATSLSPFQCSLGYQPPLFPSQETEVAVPSVWALLRRCRRVWKAARHAMINTRDRVQCVAN